MSKRTRRTDRRPEGCRLRLTRRDGWILGDVGKMRFATTGLVTRLHFSGSRSAANKRLRRLFDAGLLRTWAPRRDGENVYALTPRGARSVPGAAEWSTPRGLDGNLEHLLAVSGVRVAIAMTLGDEAELVRWRSYWELEAPAGAPVIPDALFEIRSTRGSGTFGLEVDRTVPAPQAFVRRLLSYDAVGGHGYGASEFVLLIAGSDKGWLERYRLRVAEHPLRVSVWFGILSEIQAKGAHATWRSLRGAVAPSLQALLAVRKGKEGESINAAQG